MMKLSYEIKLNKKEMSVFNRLVLIFLTFPFIEPSGLLTYLGSSWTWGWQYFVLLDFILLLAIFLLMLRELRIVYLLYGLFFVPIAASTFLNGGEILAAFYHPARMIGFVILIQFAARQGKLFELLSTLKTLTGIYILCNLFFQFYKQDFWGYTTSQNYVNFFQPDNFQGYWYIAFILIVYLSNIQKTKFRQTVEMAFWLCVCLASLVRAWAATCLVVFIIYFLLIVFRFSRIMELFTPWKAFVANLIFNVLVIFFQLQNHFSWLIVDILHKSITLGRIRVWEAAIANIVRKPILGYGTNASGRMSINYIGYNGISSIHYFSHNIFLEVTIQGGCLALVFLAILYYAADRKTKKVEEVSGIKRMIFLSLFCNLFMQFTEFMLYEPFANIPLILCFFYQELIDQSNIQRVDYSRRKISISLMGRVIN